MKKNIEQSIVELVAKSLKVDQKNISLESRFVEDLRADSLDIVELMMAVEAEFSCDIPDEAAGKILTVSDVVKYIENVVNSDESRS